MNVKIHKELDVPETQNVAATLIFGFLIFFSDTFLMTLLGMVSLNPVFGTACAVLVAPFVTCCLYYATAFAKGYNVKPWLGYVLLAAVTMFPRIATGVFGWWNTTQQFVLFAVQFPIHLCCCILYTKTDSIWAPIFTQMGVNLASCLLIILTKV